MTSPFDGLPDVFTGALGRVVTLIDALGRSRDVPGVFRRPSVQDVDVSYRETTLHLREADAAELRDGAGCLVFVDGETFEPMVSHPDGHGMIVIELKPRAPA